MNYKEQAIKLCHNNPLAFGRIYFPEYFTNESATFHYEIHDLLNDMRNERLAIAAPRGFSKSTQITFIRAIYELCYRYSNYTVLISDTAPQANSHLKSIELGFEEKKDLRSTFDLRITKRYMSPTMGGQLEFNDGKYSIYARGRGQKIRGTRHKEKRPKLIILDDIENDDSVRKQETRERTKEWLYGEVEPALDVGGRLILIGNIIHYDGILVNVMSDPGYITRVYRALINNDKESLWPDRFPVEKLIEIRERLRKQGLIRRWAMEYMNEAVTPEDQIFAREGARYFNDALLETKDVLYYLIVDPAISQDEDACDTGIVVVGVERPSVVDLAVNQVVEGWCPNFFVVAHRSGKMLPEEIIDTAVDYAKKYRVFRIGVESIAYQKMLKQQMERRFLAENISSRFVELKSQTKGKAYRILGLEQYWKAGSFHFRHGDDDLIDEFVNYPKSKTIDRLDAIAYVPDIMVRPPSINHHRVVSGSYLKGTIP